MYLICPVHTTAFLEKCGFGVEAHITRDDQRPDWEEYVPYVRGVHLPYAKLNLAAYDEELRAFSIESLKSAIDTGCRYPVDKMVMHCMGILAYDGVEKGCYENMIDSIGKVADYAAAKGITLCLENQAQHIPHRDICAVTADQWHRIYEDVDRKNVMLTLDTSHAAAAAALIPGEQARFDYLYEFLKYPERIGRVHWSDSKLSKAYTYYKDMHLVPGAGDLPREFHRAIKDLAAVKTLEQKSTEEEVLQALEFIDSL